MRAGEKRAKVNKEQKHFLGHGANMIANKFLNELKGQHVCVTNVGTMTDDDFVIRGILAGFDLYAMLIIDEDKGPVLVFKGPGMIVAQESTFYGKDGE